MDRTLNLARPDLALPSHRAIAVPAPDIEVQGWASPWLRLLPLWRYALVAAMVFGMAVFAVAVRGDVQRTMKELDRNESLRREARIQNERLHLELASRRRAVAMEQAAATLAVGPEAALVDVEARP